MADTNAKLKLLPLDMLALTKDLMDADTMKKIEAAVSSSVKYISQSVDKYTIYFYTKNAPVTEDDAAFSIQLPTPIDISGKADKVKNAVAGNFAGLDANGNLVDSGKKASSFDTAGAAASVETKLRTLIGTIPADAVAKNIVAYIQEVVSDGSYDDTAVRALIKSLQDAVTTLNGTGDGSVKKAISDLQTALQTQIGSITTLKTANKANLVVSINEVFDKVAALTTSSAITIDSTATTAGMLKSYTVKQGTKTIGTIDVPKDMVVKSGAVVTNPVGQPAGTYIELTLANATSDKIYVNVGTLVDIYTTEASATKVQLNINPTTRVISATIVSGSITATELASNAVTATKIQNGAVSFTKLATDVQTKINDAVSAIDALEGLVGAGYEAITEAEIRALFT